MFLLSFSMYAYAINVLLYTCIQMGRGYKMIQQKSLILYFSIQIVTIAQGIIYTIINNMSMDVICKRIQGGRAEGKNFGVKMPRINKIGFIQGKNENDVSDTNFSPLSIGGPSFPKKPHFAHLLNPPMQNINCTQIYVRVQNLVFSTYYTGQIKASVQLPQCIQYAKRILSVLFTTKWFGDRVSDSQNTIFVKSRQMIRCF
eukprot:TRINITY_DN16983_c0_g1_i10.p3 TRINITY_DN16983_c0_g1~~TRINITY_DN16983_c0_g1_i10.p3  ORF type:complete len:201 (-),score=-13.78 TRINITY_DN16983_c0_g1_i10:1762-2364(-)